MKHVLIPTNLKLQQLLENNPPEFEYDIDNFLYIIGTILRRKSIHKDYQNLEYVPLNAQILQSKVRNYGDYIKYLYATGIIEINPQYFPGIKSRGYKLSTAYSECETELIELKRSTLVNPSKAEKKEQKILYKEYGYLIKWFNSNLLVDVDAADKFQKNYFSKLKAGGDTNAIEKYYLSKNSLKMLSAGNYSLSVDKTGKRFHSNLTNLKSDLRNFLNYGGKRLCNTDIKNSQPFFSILFFNLSFYEKSEENLNIYSLSTDIYNQIEPMIPKIQSILYNNLSNLSTPNYIMLVNELVKQDESQASNDLELYCTLVDKGRLYQYINECFFKEKGIRYNLHISEEKKIIKQAFFYTIFSPNNTFSQENGAMKRLFIELFPTVYRIFSLIKRAHHRNLSVILQLVESEIVIRNAAKAISIQHPSLPIFTVHDSIATINEDEPKKIVWQALKEECLKTIGLRPSLNPETWDINKVTTG